MGFINNQVKTIEYQSGAMCDYSAIPSELKKLPNWVCWKASPDPSSHSGIKKEPINPHTGGRAMSNNPQTWSDFDTAVKRSAAFTGIGFMFGGSGYMGIDLDDMPDDLNDYLNGGADNIVAEFVNGLKSYAELSQSGTGIHIIGRGKLPKGGRRKKLSCGGFEMYDSGRFFVMTGKSCSPYAEIADCTESVKPLHSKYIGAQPPSGKSPSGGGTARSAKGEEIIKYNASPLNPPSRRGAMSNNDILTLAQNAKNGAAFSRLYGGDTSGYGSHSEADMALCNMLAFWCGRDADKMDSLFRGSGLMREKWDRKQSGSTYGAITVAKAIASCTEVYTPTYGANNFRIGQSSECRGGYYPPGARSAPTAHTEARSNECNPSESDNLKLYTLDDMGNAARFIDLFGEGVRYCYTEKKWYYYNKLKWCADNVGMVMQLADRAVEAMKAEGKFYTSNGDEEMVKQFNKHVKSSRSNKSKKNMLDEARHHVPVLPAQMDKYRMALNTPAGVINLKTGKTSEHKPEYYFTKSTAVDCASAADCPLWLDFLNDVFCGDKDLIRYIQKAVGYSLTGSTAEQCAFFLYGTGRNGKSTFLEVIRGVMGDYASNIQPETVMIRNTQSSAINSDIARLKGARLVTSVEPNEGVRINEGLLKQLTGDDTVTARKLYSEEFEFKPEFKLWMATNHKPIIRGTDTGIWRRIHMVPFTAQIPENKVDKNLPKKLKTELPAIFKWCLEGCVMWQNEGLKMPAAVLESVKEYRREMDVVSSFIEDKCELSGSVQSSALFAAYTEWAATNNEYKMSNTKFGIEINKRFEKVRTTKGIFYNGISLI